MPLWLILSALLILALMVTGLIKSPVHFAYASTALFGTLCTLYAVLRLGAALSPPPRNSALGFDNLPVFSILLPVYREAHMISTLVSHIQALDYPANRLDIMIVCEPDDPETIAAASALENPALRVFVTSGAGPKTKPNALNAAMSVARGDIITVYDAEDRPHPSQLRAAAYSMTTNPRLAVVQAPLTYYNARQKTG